MFQLQLRDDNDVLVAYIDNKVRSISWDWDRIGGCGACQIQLVEPFDGVLAGSLAEDYSVRAYIDDTLWYSGFIDRVAPSVTGKEETINTSCLGYVNQLKRIIVKDKTYSGWELSDIIEDILDNYVVGNSSITSTSPDYDNSGFMADNLYFNESAYDVISKLADIAGKMEWGVRADKSFFFKKRNDATTRYYHIKESFSSFQPIRDFNPIITRVYIEGGEGYKNVFSVTNRVSLREVIVSNSSIISQSVGQQYARMFLKENGQIKKSYVAVIPNYNTRIEATLPIGAAAVNLKIGINHKYDVASQLYDSGLKYDGGTESFQIEKIKYTLKDDKIDTTLNFGPVPSGLSDELKRLEFLIENERNI